MKVFDDHRCEDCGYVAELYLEQGTTSSVCTECGGPARRVIRPIRTNLDPISGDFPGATMAWERGREGTKKRERKSSAYCPKQGTVVRD